MSVFSIRDILDGRAELGSRVTIQGWVRTRRDSKAGLSFIHVNDGSCFDPLQVVAPGDLANYEDEVQHLTAGCAVEADGELVESKGRGQSVEIQATAVRVIGWVEDPDTYPIQPKRHTYEYLREVAHLRPRTNTFGAVTRVRNCLAQATHRFFHERGYYWIATPIITASDAEGAGELFRVSNLDLANLPRTDDGRPDFSRDFFGQETYLTVSGQLNVECYALAMTKCYTFGPTFRAENSNTSRHMAEFWMIEPEIAFADLDDNADLAEDLLKYQIRAVLEECPQDMAFFDKHVQEGVIQRLEDFESKSFERMDYAEAIRVLEASGKKFEYPAEWGLDLQTEHERYLTEQHVQRPVVVMNYPDEIKAFYMRLNDDGKTVAAMDVLAPGIGEIIGGSQREERLNVLERRMREHGMDMEAYDWYLDLRRYGTVPHAGFGLGLERLISYVTGLGNVRDTIPFPRTPGNAPF
jgi:asparaginyl-tRNA synthetase